MLATPLAFRERSKENAKGELAKRAQAGFSPIERWENETFTEQPWNAIEGASVKGKRAGFNFTTGDGSLDTQSARKLRL